MTETLKNYVVSLHGRGASYAFLVKGEVQDVANRCKPCTNSGFEVYIYELTTSPHGAPGFAPTGSMPLKMVFHLFDAHDQWRDEANSIVDKLTMHSEVASIEYLEGMIEILGNERINLQERQHNVQVKDGQVPSGGGQTQLPVVVSETPEEKPNAGQAVAETQQVTTPPNLTTGT